MFFLLEICLVLVALGLAFAFPKLGDSWFSHWEERFARLARRSALSVVVVGLSALAVRAALLPVEPIPYPGVSDEFSQLPAADTFAHGRLTNPPHPMWVHFEALSIIQQPTYASKYPVAPPLLMAAGQKITGHPFWGVWFGIGLMCGGICWMLQGWLPETWALLGGFIAVIRFGSFNYWANSYLGGAGAAFSGALILGALPRIKKNPRAHYAIAMALGLAILGNTRPYEGLCFSIPIVLSLLWWFFRQEPFRWPSNIYRIVVPLVLILALTGAGMSYYCWRVTGNPLRLPYQLYQQQYDPSPYFLWQSPRPLPVYRHQVILVWELYRTQNDWLGHTLNGFLTTCLLKLLGISSFFVGPIFGLILFGALAIAPQNLKWRDLPSELRLLLIVLGVSLLAVALEPSAIPHYLGQATCVFIALILLAMQSLRRWTWRGAEVGRSLGRTLMLICVLLLGARAVPRQLRISTSFPVATWCSVAPQDDQNLDRAHIVSELESLPRKHLVIVHYSPAHIQTELAVSREWVYNAADIDASKIAWAQDMGPEKNQELIDYYKDRKVWLVEPDKTPPQLSPYADAMQQKAVAD